MMRLLSICVASLLLSSQGICKENHESLHALILYDSTPSKLKTIHKADVQSMKDALKRISGLIKARLHLKVVKKYELTLDDMNGWFKKVHPRKDIVFVYYSGGEDKNDSYSGNWPSICFGKQSNSTPLSADMLCEIIQGSKPRLQLVFLDFYDKKVKVSTHEGAKFSNPFKKKRLPVNFISKYWPKTDGSLLACSHAKGALGFGITNGKKRIGSFTQCVLQALLRISATGYSDFLEKYPFGCYIPDDQRFLLKDSLKCPLPTSGIRNM